MSDAAATVVAVACLAVVALVVVVSAVLVRAAGRRSRGAVELVAANEARLRTVADAVPAGVFQTDADGRLVYANPRLLALTGDTSLQDALARPWLIHEEDQPRVRQEFAVAVVGRSAFSSKFRIPGADGGLRWVAVEAAPLLADDGAGAITGWVGTVLDATDEVGAVARLRRFSEILEATPDLVAMTDVEGRFTYANAAARARFGVTSEEAMRRLHAADVYAPASRSRFFREALPSANRHGVWTGEIDLLLPDGGEVPVSQVVVAHRRLDGSIDYYSSITRDLSERHALQEQIAQAGMYDAVTGLPNRPVLVEALGAAIDAAIDRRAQVAVMLIDVDHFKLVNDSFGHASGDLLLRLVAQRLGSVLHASDLLARFGSDVFCLLSSAAADEAAALALADRVHAAMASPLQLDGDEVFVTVSTGIALSGDGQQTLATPETLLRDADAALHRAKERGRARSELFIEDIRVTAVNRLRTANDLHRALTEQEFRVVYQPEVDLHTGHITGVEALVRWHHPDRGLVPPVEFIPLAEQTGLIAGIGAWVLDTALEQAARWSTARADSGPLSVWVNLSARQLGDPGLVDLVASCLARHGVAPSQLGLEITESALLEDAEGAVTALTGLRDLGVRLAVDDFGTGYSSLSYLKRLPVDAVKIDRSFVDGLAVDGDDSAIVAAVAGMARALRLTTIAEGVENVDQLQALRRLGCDLAQGYYFTTPQPPAHISRLLEDDRDGAPLFRLGEDHLPTQRQPSR